MPCLLGAAPLLAVPPPGCGSGKAAWSVRKQSSKQGIKRSSTAFGGYAQQQQQDGLYSPSHALLTMRIKLCTTSMELAAVLEEHSTHFNQINMSAALVRLAQLPPGPQPPPPGSSSRTDAQAWDAYASYEALLQRMLQLVAGQVPTLGARQVANVMWAAARLGSRSPDGFHPLCAALLGLLLPQSQVMLPWSNPQELSSRWGGMNWCGVVL